MHLGRLYIKEKHSKIALFGRFSVPCKLPQIVVKLRKKK